MGNLGAGNKIVSALVIPTTFPLPHLLPPCSCNGSKKHVGWIRGCGADLSCEGEEKMGRIEK
jgi:hypothetical protein